MKLPWKTLSWLLLAVVAIISFYLIIMNSAHADIASGSKADVVINVRELGLTQKLAPGTKIMTVALSKNDGSKPIQKDLTVGTSGLPSRVLFGKMPSGTFLIRFVWERAFELDQSKPNNDSSRTIVTHAGQNNVNVYSVARTKGDLAINFVAPQVAFNPLFTTGNALQNASFKYTIKSGDQTVKTGYITLLGPQSYFPYKVDRYIGEINGLDPGTYTLTLEDQTSSSLKLSPYPIEDASWSPTKAFTIVAGQLIPAKPLTVYLRSSLDGDIKLHLKLTRLAVPGHLCNTLAYNLTTPKFTALPQQTLTMPSGDWKINENATVAETDAIIHNVTALFDTNDRYTLHIDNCNGDQLDASIADNSADRSVQVVTNQTAGPLNFSFKGIPAP